MEKGNYILGEEVKQFEKEFADYCGVKHCIGTGNGLDSLRLSLLASGVGPGDEVIVPSNTFIATWLAVTQVGATPVPVEPNERTYNIQAEEIEKAIGGKTKAVIPVDLYGQPVDAHAIMAVASDNDIVVIGDAAQSQGASFKGKKTGSFFDLECFSFYPVKNLGAVGDAGAVTTNSDELDRKIRMLRNYGSSGKYIHELLGLNSRLDELQAGILRVKLKHLDEWNEKRRGIAKHYTQQFDDLSREGQFVIAPWVPEATIPSWHLYVLRVKERDRVRKHLKNEGIETIVHYPVPPHLQEAYSFMNFHRGSFPLSERLADEVISLPLYPSLSMESVDQIIHSVLDVAV